MKVIIDGKVRNFKDVKALEKFVSEELERTAKQSEKLREQLKKIKRYRYELKRLAGASLISEVKSEGVSSVENVSESVNKEGEQL